MKRLLIAILLSCALITSYGQLTTPRYFSRESVNHWMVAITNKTVKADTTCAEVFIDDTCKQHESMQLGDITRGYVVLWHTSVLYFLGPNKKPLYSMKDHWLIYGRLCDPRDPINPKKPRLR